MKNLFKFLFAIIIAGSTIYFSSCERESASSVDQDRIYTIYDLYYNANADITYARATFKFGNSAGTLLELNEGTISFQADGQTSTHPLSFKETLAYYEKEYAGFVSTGTFVYEDEDGNTFSNTINIDSINYPDTLADISKGSSYELYFEGTPLGENDEISLTIEGPYNGDMKLFYQDDMGATSIVLPANKTSEMGIGTNIMYMDRRYQPDISQAPSAGGKITGRFRPVNQNIEVVN